MPRGSSRCSASSSRSSRAVSSTVFAPGCFCTPTMTAGRPLREPSPRLSAAPFAHVGDVAHEHRPVAAQRDHAVADLLGRPRTADGLEDVLLRTFHVDPGGRVLAGAAHRVQQLGDRDVVGAQLVGVRDDLELPLGAADRRDLRDAGDREQTPPHERVGHRAQRQRIVAGPRRARRRGSRP